MARPRALVLLAAAGVLLLVGVLAERATLERHRQDIRVSLSEQINALGARIEGNILAKSHLIRGLSAAIQLENGLSQERFELVASTLKGNNSDIINIAAAPDLVIRFVYPMEQNRAVLGVDYRTSVQMPAIQTAIDTGQTVMAGPVDLIQGRGRAYILRVPIYINQGLESSRFWGIVSLVIGVEEFNRNVGLSDPGLGFDVALRGVDGTGQKGQAFFGAPETFENSPVLRSIQLPFGTWQLAAVPTNGWSRQIPGFPLFALGYGVLSLLLLWGLNTILSLSAKRRAAEERLANAIEAIDDGFALYDPQGRFVTCNQKYRELYNLSQDLMVPGTPFEHIIREGVRRGQYRAAVGREEDWIAERLAAHERADEAVIQQLSNGRWLKIAERKTSDGSTVGFRVDITELTEAKEAAENANRAKTDFINVLSHELRTPMTVVLGYTSILGNPKLFKTAREMTALIEDPEADTDAFRAKAEALLKETSDYAKKIQVSGNQLLSLINELLDFSKIEAGQIEIDATEFDLSAIATSVAEQFRFLAQRKGLKIRCDVPPLQVLADTKRTQQVLVNLVSNALKFTEAGQVRISAEQIGEQIHVQVEDTGCGIPEHMQAEVFKEFQQVDSSSTRKSGGTGLGLAIVKRIVEGQGGRVWLKSSPEIGTRVTFTLRSAAGQLPEQDGLKTA